MEIEIDENLIESDLQNVQSLPDEFSVLPTFGNDASYDRFFRDFMLPNRPCLIENVSDKWECSRMWFSDGRLNIEHLDSIYGHLAVPVHLCNSQRTSKAGEWNFSQYLKYWCTDRVDSAELYYLKDWHLKNKLPNNNFYTTPLYFISDWLNEYLVETNKDDYRFVYFGVKGTWTPFHADVMTSFSWSVNVRGRKLWYLFPPGEEDAFRDAHGNMIEDVNALDDIHKRRCYRVVQDAGNAMFIPANWYHQVWNLEDTVSVNHNWINGCNLLALWRMLEKNLVDIKAEIDDCRDMDDFTGHCQVMLRAVWNGMDFAQFYDFVTYVALKRIGLLEKGVPVILMDGVKLGRNHALFDLHAIQTTLSLFNKNDDVCKLKHTRKFDVLPGDLLNRIREILVRYGRNCSTGQV